MTTTRTRLGCWLVMSALLLPAAGCAINPATGKRQLSLISERDEIQIGRANDEQIVAGLGLYGGPEMQEYIQQLGERLAARSERPDLDYDREGSRARRDRQRLAGLAMLQPGSPAAVGGMAGKGLVLLQHGNRVETGAG